MGCDEEVLDEIKTAMSEIQTKITDAIKDG
jgi:hypothetical protein